MGTIYRAIFDERIILEYEGDLKESDLKGKNLWMACIRGMKFSLDDETTPHPDWITLCKVDFMNTVNLFRTNGEVQFLRQAIVEGRIDGTAYEGDCACLVGTLANARGKDYFDLCFDVGYRKSGYNPAEIWFWHIKEGDTPENNSFAKTALEWCDEMLAQEQK